MSIGPHRRCLPFLRALVCGMFALALVLQPALAATAEMHELAHDPTGGHQHALHSENLAQELTAVDKSDDSASMLHTLLHFSHSCGEAAAEVPVLPPIAFRRMWHPLSVLPVPMPGQPYPSVPFKPPIFV